METEKIKEIKNLFLMKKIEELFGKAELEDLDVYNFDFSDVDNVDDFLDKCQENIYEQEIIYYSEAKKILKENEENLSIAISLAKELGFDLEKIIDECPDYDLFCSETLATIFYQQELSEKICEVREDVENIFERAEKIENWLEEKN